MKYSFNTWVYGSFPTWVPSYPLEEVIKRLSRIGYDGIEIGCASPHAWPYYLNAEKRKNIKLLFNKYNIKVSSMLPAPGGGPGANPASSIKEEREWTIKHYKDIIDLAYEWESPVIIYVAGWKIFGTSQKDAWNYSLDSLVQIAEYAKTKGITICIEPTSADSNVVETADDALMMMEESGLPNVGVMFDTFHVLYRNEDPTDYVYTIKEHLKHIHISDYDRLPPGKGGMDFFPLMQALKDVGYNGYVTMEVGFNSRSSHPDSIARQALEHLKQIESQLK